MKYTTQIISSSLIVLSLLTSINTNAQRVVKCADGSLVTAISLCPAPDAVQSGGYNTNPDSKPSSRFGSPIYDSSKIDSGTIGISNSTSPALNGATVSKVNQSNPRTRINNGVLSTNVGNTRNTKPIFTDRNKKLKPDNTQVNGYTKFKGVGSYTLAKKTENSLVFAELSDSGKGIVSNTTITVPISSTITESSVFSGNRKIKDYISNSYSPTEKQRLLKLAKNLRSVYLRQFRITNTNNNRQLPSPATRSIGGNTTTNIQPTNKPTSDKNKPIVNKPASVNNTPAPCVGNDGFRYPTATDGTGCPKLP